MATIKSELDYIQEARSQLAEALITKFGVRRYDNAKDNPTLKGLWTVKEDGSADKLKRLHDWALLVTGTNVHTDASLTFKNDGKGDAAGTTFNGSVARSISYNSIGAAASNHVHKNLIIKWGAGDTEGTNLFTYNGSTAKTINLSAPFSLLFTSFGNVDTGFKATNITATVSGVTKSFAVNWAIYAGRSQTADKWTTARTLTIGNTGKSVDGSANVSWSLAEIGVSAAAHTHSVKINGATKTIAASNGAAVDLGNYLPLSGGTMKLGEGLKFHADENYFGTYLDARIISLLDGNGTTCDGGLIIDERCTSNGTEYVTELLRIRDTEFKWKGLNILHSGNSSVSGGGSTWGSSITVKINGTSKTLTIPSNPNTDITVKQTPKTDNVNRPLMMINGSTSTGEQINTSIFSTGIYANASTKMITANGFIKAGSSNSYVLLGGGDHKAVSDFATSGHNHDGRYVRAFGTSNDNIDSDWGLSFKTFDPIPSGTPPEKNPNISILNIGDNFNRRKLLAFIYSNDNIYYRRHIDNSFTNWRRLAFITDIPTVTDYYWADVKVSAISNATTNPTFNSATATDRINATNYIFLNPNGSGIYLNSTSLNWHTKSSLQKTLLSFTSNGNVGIRTSSPSAQLHIYQTSCNGSPYGTYIQDTGNCWALRSLVILAPNLTSGSSPFIIIGKLDSTKNNGWIGYVHNADGSDLNRLSFGLHNVDNVLNILGTGNVGIGTTSPLYKLDVHGDTKITGSIRDLAVGGGIYWNPYVESTTDNSDKASITLVKSGVAGGTALVLSLMNDVNDTILFLTNTAARLYHNSYPILTTLNTYVSNNKGYINNTEITLVNNSDTLDNLHSYAFKRTWEAYAGGTYVGWITIAKWVVTTANHFSPYPFMLSIYRVYASPSTETYTFSITFGWNTAHITQVSGNGGSRIIEKLRITKCSDNLTYKLEMYVNTNYTTYANPCRCVAYGYYGSDFSATPICELTSDVVNTLTEITTALNCIVGDLNGNADKVDGYHASSLITWSDLVDRIPNISWNDAANGVKIYSHYRSNSLGEYRAILLCKAPSNNIGLEFNAYWCVNPSDSANLNNIYFRVKRDAASDWGPYTKLLQSDGNATITGSYYANSDIRYKLVQSLLLNKANYIAELPIFTYYWNDELHDKNLHIGSSAQAVKKVFPELVTYDESKDFYNLDYATLGTIAGITACKELVNLKSEIELLKERIKELELQLKMINDYGRC